MHLYNKPQENHRAVLRRDLEYLYGPTGGASAFVKLTALLDHYHGALIPQKTALPLTCKDAILITYADQVTAPGRAPLEVLNDFCLAYLKGLVSGIHILPFYPYSSDDGFSVIDYRQVDPQMGNWPQVKSIGRHFKLMFDAVINHISAQSDWFKTFLRDDPLYRDYFITVDGSPDLSRVVRPRTLPLLTHFNTPSGQKALWTTFSDDQIDLNYTNPDVLLNIIDILLFYVSNGAELIRLDAIAYLWKQIGTTCIHLPQTHHIIQLFHTVLDEVAPWVQLITETNVPHPDNISYFGAERSEAQLVYNFALPPLVLHTLRGGNARALSGWAAALSLPKPGVTFFNFLASHDGIGLNPARGILTPQEIESLVEGTLQRGGLVSSKNNPDGSVSPYELNINYFDALALPDDGAHPDRAAARFMVAQGIMLALAGVPGIYFHSLFGSRGWPQGVQLTKRARSVNRQKLPLSDLQTQLADKTSERYSVFQSFSTMLAARSACEAFDPYAGQSILDFGEHIFALKRTAPNAKQTVYCLFNVTPQSHQIPSLVDPAAPSDTAVWFDLIGGQTYPAAGFVLQPYQVLWLTRSDEKGGESYEQA